MFGRGETVAERRRRLDIVASLPRPVPRPMPEFWIHHAYSLARWKWRAGAYDTVHRGPSCPDSDLNVPWRTPPVLGWPASLARVADDPRMRLCPHCFTEREHEIMAILDLKPRMRELGRIRIGQQVPTGTEGKTRPEKLDRFRFTAHSKRLVEAIAMIYGGECVEWTPAGGTPGWEVITNAQRIPVLIPPAPADGDSAVLSQWYEVWSGGGCQRRCDGIHEWLTDKPCICAANGQKDAERECKATTRLNVIIRDVPGVGTFRLESHGWNAASELPQLAGFLEKAADAGEFLPAWLGLEERIVKRPGQGTRRFMVPTLEVDITPAALMAGERAPAAIEAAGPRELPAAAEPGGVDSLLLDEREKVKKLLGILGWDWPAAFAAYAKTYGGKLDNATLTQLTAFREQLDGEVADLVAEAEVVS